MKKFKWLKSSGYDKRGKRLKSGEIYNAEDFPPETVKEWIKTGAAEAVGKSEKSTSEVK
jgi:hypothetical protein